MNRLFVATLFVLGVFTSSAPAVDIKNIRPCYTPIGATRTDLSCLPKDVLWFTYDIENLAIDPKTGKANYVAIVEFLDPKEKTKDSKDGKLLFKRETPNEVIPPLGGARMPAEIYLEMGNKQPPGKYSIKLTVHDKIGKDAKAFRYDFDVLPDQFGFARVAAPAIGLYGQQYFMQFWLVNLGLDAKGQPNADLTIRFLDDKGKAATTPVKMEFPRDLPDGVNLSMANVVPVPYPIYLNRSGRFTVEIQATDKVSKKSKELRYPLTVIDVAGFAK